MMLTILKFLSFTMLLYIGYSCCVISPTGSDVTPVPIIFYLDDRGLPLQVGTSEDADLRIISVVNLRLPGNTITWETSDDFGGGLPQESMFLQIINSSAYLDLQANGRTPNQWAIEYEWESETVVDTLVIESFEKELRCSSNLELSRDEDYRGKYVGEFFDSEGIPGIEVTLVRP